MLDLNLCWKSGYADWSFFFIIFLFLVFSQYLEENAETLTVDLELHASEFFSVHSTSHCYIAGAANDIVIFFPQRSKKRDIFSLFRCNWWEAKGSNKDKPIVVCIRKCNISSGGWKVQTHSLQGLQIDKAFTGKKICFSVFNTSGKPGLIFGENAMSILVGQRLL